MRDNVAGFLLKPELVHEWNNPRGLKNKKSTASLLEAEPEVVYHRHPVTRLVPPVLHNLSLHLGLLCVVVVVELPQAPEDDPQKR